MTSFFGFDEIFRDFDELMKKMRGFKEIKALKRGKLKGRWNVKQIDEPNIKGYIIQGRFQSDHPFEPFDPAPFDPFTPHNPFERRPNPQGSFRPSAIASKKTREPLTDIFKEEKAVKIYLELPGEEKDDIQLNVTNRTVEIKTKNFYKMIDVPPNLDVENASSQYNNGVLTIIIPTDETIPTDEKRRITID